MRNPVSRRYARAFLDIGVERGNYKALQKQLRDLATIYGKSTDLQSILANPSVRAAERRAIVQAIAKKSFWDPMMMNLALLLIDNDRIQYVDDIANVLDAMVDEHEGNVRAIVSTARPLNPMQVANVKKAIQKMTGKGVLLETKVDPDLLGGAVTRIGGTVYDGSIRTQLDSLRDSILEEV